MAIFKQRVTRPVPKGAKIITRKDKQLAQWTDRRGKLQTAELTKSGSRIATEAATWSVRYRDADGIVQTVSTGCRDKTAAQAKEAELERTAERIRSGVLSTTDAEVGKWQNVPLSEHVADYLADLRGRGVNADRIKTSKTYLTNDCDGCGFRWLRDLNADALRKWLRTDSEMGAATYNWHSSLWTAFGWWLTGRRIDGKRQSQTGDRRLATNPFDGFGKKNESENRRRVARALTTDEMRRLLDQARRRPLEDALTIRRGKNAGQQTAKISAERRAKLERLGMERALIYKTAILTGLRLNELRTLRVRDLSFGDVPFLKLTASNEKNRKGSTVPLRVDLAADLQRWTAGKGHDTEVFNVPTGLLRILNRDLVAAGIDKIDERQGRVHLHALRHSTGTALSVAGVSPRTAQAVMRHSDIALTMNTYTDERLLNAADAVALLPELPLGETTKQAIDTGKDGKSSPRTVTTGVTLKGDNSSVLGSIPDKTGEQNGPIKEQANNAKPQRFAGFPEVESSEAQLNFFSPPLLSGTLMFPTSF